MIRFRRSYLSVIVLLVSGCRDTQKQSDVSPVVVNDQQPPAITPTAVPAPVLPHRILTKNEHYVQYVESESRLGAPESEGFIEHYSASYRAWKASALAKTAAMQDPTLREAEVQKMADALDWSPYVEEAQKNYLTERMKFFDAHKKDWFEIGHCKYDPKTEHLNLSSTYETATKSDMSLPVSLVAIDKIWSEFNALTQDVVQQASQTDIAKANDFREKYREGGGNSTTILESVGDDIADAKEREIERLKETRLIAVAEGDVNAKRIDRVLLVDYDTEKVFASFPGTDLEPKEIVWKPALPASRNSTQ